MLFSQNKTLSIPENSRSREVQKRILPALSKSLQTQSLLPGCPVFIRIFKEERVLELWCFSETAKTFLLFKRYPVAGMSGHLGPKLKEGDRQAPEGFYRVYKEQLNPSSKYHLSFNIGYPNAFDRALGRTGSFIMVHGGRLSIGCFAMTDPAIEEIYTLSALALGNGQPYIPVHIFPFRLTSKRLLEMKQSSPRGPWNMFWEDLSLGYQWFEDKKIPPHTEVNEGRYEHHSATQASNTP